MKLGIVGLPNVGKSTLFNAITKAGAEASNYPFCTIEPNVGTVAVPDERLAFLAGLYDPEKITPAIVEFVDIAGLVAGASKGEGLGNKFLSHIREVDAIVHVVRCFEDTDVIHVSGTVDPAEDIAVVNTELILSDIDMVDKRIDRTAKMMKAGDHKLDAEMALYRKIRDALDIGTPARALTYSPEEADLAEKLFLLSYKPVIYAANISEKSLQHESENPLVGRLRAVADSEGADVVVICAKIEEEIAELDDSEKSDFLRELGLSESGLDKLVKASYHILGLISFLTAGPKEVRAWTIKRGTRAPQAAGKIHTDFEHGFIRAEIVAYEDLHTLGSHQAAKEKGLVRSEGKEYVMKDGDVVLFRFNV